MKWFYNLKTAAKLITAFVIISVILGFVGIFGLYNLNKMNDSLASMYNDNFVPAKHISDAQILYQRYRVNQREVRDAGSNAERDKFKQNLTDIKKELTSRIEAYKKTSLSEEEKEIAKPLDSLWQDFIRVSEQGVQLAYEGKEDVFSASLKSGELRELGDKLNDVLQKLVETNVKLAEKANVAGDETYESARSITITVIIVSLLLCVGFGYLISQMIARPLNRVVALVARVSEGDLTEMSDIETKDEVGKLAGSINDMIASLRKMIGSILASAESVSAAAQQISASTEEIASGSTNQANAAQTMSELFRELSVAVSSVARSAEQASELANTTMNTAREGGLVVQDSIQGMEQVNLHMSKLEEDSNKIGEIIEVIDDIADQTNLLALNAAIEAARAGDQGRGFAVVADEVRKLAERSSEATKQITGIIKGMQLNTMQSVKAVGAGVVSSQKTGEAFDAIMAMVSESAGKVSEIAAASEEQSAQTSEVLLSIESISAATEEAAASSEETAATAQSLAQLAEELNESVAFFKIRN